jgi:hypothetical protein
LVPPFVATFTSAPCVCPTDASKAAVWTRNSLIAAAGGENATRGDVPSEYVFDTPSIWNSLL